MAINGWDGFERRIRKSQHFEVLSLRMQHGKFFQYADGLKAQRKWIIHQTGLRESQLDWNDVWNTVDSRLKNILLPELTYIICKESGRKLLKLEENIRGAKYDKSKNTRSQNSNN